MAAFCGGLAGAGLLARALGRDPQEHTTLDLVTLALATYKAARTLSRDEVTSFLREPFVEGHAHEGGEEPVENGGMRQAIGELVTCSRCIGTWVAAGGRGGPEGGPRRRGGPPRGPRAGGAGGALPPRRPPPPHKKKKTARSGPPTPPPAPRPP